jgi:hypothetical protein
MTTVIPDSHLDLFTKPIYAVVTTVMPDGQPQSTIVWVNLEDGYVCFNTARGRQKDKNLDANPKVTLVLLDPENPFRWLEVRGVVEAGDEADGVAHIERLSRKYTGRGYYGDFNTHSTPQSETRVKYRINATRVNVFGQ